MSRLSARRVGLGLWAAAAALWLGPGSAPGGAFVVQRPGSVGRSESLVARHVTAIRKTTRTSDRHGPRATTAPLFQRRKKVKNEPPPLTSQQRDQLAYETALEECVGTKNYKRAIMLLDLMAFRGLERRREAWTSAVRACGKAGRPDEARKLLESMRGAGFVPDHAAYHSAVEACKHKAAPKQALALLREMREVGFPPNGLTYTQVITTLVQSGYKQEAAELYDEAQQQGMYHVWGKDARFLDLQELNIQMARIAIRAAIEERAGGKIKTGKTGFYILTGPNNKSDALKQQAVLSVLRSEYGLKVRVDPAKFGRVLIRGDQLKRLGMEREMERESRRDSRRESKREYA